MQDTSVKKKEVGAMERWIKYVIIVLVVVLVFLLFFLVRDYRALRRAQVINTREALLNIFVRNHGYLTATDASVVRSWMTFDYINKLFGIPSGYLKSELSITDPRYPKFTLSSYAKAENVTSATEVSDVESALRGYFATSTPVVSTST